MAWFYIFVFSFSTIFHSISNAEHDIHISKCNAHYKSESNSLQLIVHLFLDDLELALKDKGGSELSICTDKEDPNSEAYLLEYLKSHFVLKLNDRELDYNFIGKEISEDIMGVYCYLEVENLPEFQGELSLFYNVFMDMYQDQQNIVSLKADGKRVDAFILDSKTFSKKISLK